MVDLVLRSSSRNIEKPFTLQLRWHESSGETEYQDLCQVNEEIAKEIIKAGQAIWLFGKPEKS